nr:MAG TPA: hypothetical protein [Caudoviricetes sp.]
MKNELYWHIYKKSGGKSISPLFVYVILNFYLFISSYFIRPKKG